MKDDCVSKATELLRRGDNGADYSWSELAKNTRRMAKKSSQETYARLRNKKAP